MRFGLTHIARFTEFECSHGLRNSAFNTETGPILGADGDLCLYGPGLLECLTLLARTRLLVSAGLLTPGTQAPNRAGPADRGGRGHMDHSIPGAIRALGPFGGGLALRAGHPFSVPINLKARDIITGFSRACQETSWSLVTRPISWMAASREACPKRFAETYAASTYCSFGSTPYSMSSAWMGSVTSTS